MADQSKQAKKGGPQNRGPLSRVLRRSWLLVPILITAAMISLDSISYFAGSDLLLHNFLYRTQPPRETSLVTIIAIDDPSLDQIGQYPWPRSSYIELLEKLKENRPAVVGFDVGFYDKTDEDITPFAETLDEVPYPVVLAAKATSVRADQGESYHLISQGLRFPLEELLSENVTVGFANVLVDQDRSVRRVPVAIDDGTGKIIPSLSVAMIHAMFGIYIDEEPLVADDSQIQLNQRVYRHFGDNALTLPITNIPVDQVGSFYVNYIGGRDSFPTVSFKDVLNGTVDPYLLKDRILIIGATTLDLHDIVNRPGLGSGQIPGVEVHAHAIDNLLSRDFLAPPNKLATIILTILYAFIAAILAMKVSTFKSGSMVIAMLLLLPVLAAFAYSYYIIDDNYGVLINLSSPILGTVLTYVGVLLVRITGQEREKAYLRQAFTQYVSPEVVGVIVSNPEKLKLGGERRELSVLFSDLRGFTSISEKLDAEQLVSFLNRYFDSMTDVVLKNKGVIDKFIGDALMAFWGAPLDEPHHARLACYSALEMGTALKEFNKSIAEDDLPELKIGIGINTGPLVVGNMGSSKRFDYTVMGDTVNLGSRLESLTKAYGIQNIVSDLTREEAGEVLIYRSLDRVKVKGKKKAVAISELIGKVEEMEKPAYVKYFEEALSFYWDRNWDKAEEYFNKALSENPDDSPSKLFIERLPKARAAKLDASWDGAFKFEHK